MRKPNTLRTLQQVARLELTTGRDMTTADAVRAQRAGGGRNGEEDGGGGL